MTKRVQSRREQSSLILAGQGWLPGGRWQDLAGQLSEAFKSLGKRVVLMQLGRLQRVPSSTLELGPLQRSHQEGPSQTLLQKTLDGPAVPLETASPGYHSASHPESALLSVSPSPCRHQHPLPGHPNLFPHPTPPLPPSLRWKQVAGELKQGSQGRLPRGGDTWAETSG